MNMKVLTKPEAATTSNLIAIFGEKCYVNIDHNRWAKKCRSCTTYASLFLTHVDAIHRAHSLGAAHHFHFLYKSKTECYD